MVRGGCASRKGKLGKSGLRRGENIFWLDARPKRLLSLLRSGRWKIRHQLPCLNQGLKQFGHLFSQLGAACLQVFDQEIGHDFRRGADAKMVSVGLRALKSGA